MKAVREKARSLDFVPYGMKCGKEKARSFCGIKKPFSYEADFTTPTSQRSSTQPI